MLRINLLDKPRDHSNVDFFSVFIKSLDFFCADTGTSIDFVILHLAGHRGKNLPTEHSELWRGYGKQSVVTNFMLELEDAGNQFLLQDLVILGSNLMEESGCIFSPEDQVVQLYVVVIFHVQLAGGFGISGSDRQRLTIWMMTSSQLILILETKKLCEETRNID